MAKTEKGHGNAVIVPALMQVRAALQVSIIAYERYLSASTKKHTSQ